MNSAEFSLLITELEYITVSPSQADAIYEAVPEPWFYVNVVE